jgi:hypothetical protein
MDLDDLLRRPGQPLGQPHSLGEVMRDAHKAGLIELVDADPDQILEDLYLSNDEALVRRLRYWGDQDLAVAGYSDPETARRHMRDYSWLAGLLAVVAKGGPLFEALERLPRARNDQVRELLEGHAWIYDLLVDNPFRPRQRTFRRTDKPSAPNPYI